MKNQGSGRQFFQAHKLNKPQDTLQIRKTPWHGVTKQPKQPSNQENTLASRRNSLLPSLCPGQTSLLNRMKKSRFWQAIHCSKAQKASQKTPFESGKHPGTPPALPLPGPNVTPEPNEKIKVLAGNSTVSGAETKPQDTLQIRKTPWHGVTKQPPAVPLPGPNVTPETNEKIKGLAGNYSRHTKQATRHPSNQENTLARRDETASCPEPNEKIKGLAGNCSRHTKQATRHPSNQENTLARRNETASCRPLPGPNVTPEPNEKIKGLAGNCSRHRNQATRHPSNQENTLARRDETASCHPSARAKRHS